MDIQVCKNCNNQFTGKYCNACGEKVYTEHDKSITHFFEDAFHFITHFEGTLFNTLKTIFSKPGKLSLDYCNGLRKKYFKPLAFFMLLVVLYLIFPFFTGLNMPFSFYISKGSFANRAISKKTGVNMDSMASIISTVVEQKDYSNEQANFSRHFFITDSIIKSNPNLAKLESRFNKKSINTSKLLLLLLIPLTSIILWVLALQKKHLAFDHLVLSTEINSFFILFSFFIVPLIVTILYKLAPALSTTIFSERSIGIFSYSVLSIYTAVAFRRFYNDKRLWAIMKSVITMAAHVIIVIWIYKFTLFAVTIYLS
jgi:hypothetical protein